MPRTAVLDPSVAPRGRSEPADTGAAAARQTCRAPAGGPEQVLAALVSYQEAVHRGVAERLGVRVEGVEVLLEVGGEHEVRFDVRLTGPDSPAAYDRVRAVVEAHAPVLDLVTG